MIPIDQLNTADDAARQLRKIFAKGCGSELCVIDRNWIWAGRAACDCPEKIRELVDVIGQAVDAEVVSHG